MSSRPETQALFNENLLEEAPEQALEQSLDADGREVATPFRGQRRVALLAGLALAAAGLLCVSAFHRETEPEAARLAATQEKAEDKLPAFKQCGGQDWVNSTCCRAGCACVAETKYYSQCKTPEGLQVCSIKRAKEEPKAAGERVTVLKNTLDSKKDTEKAAQKALEKAMGERKAAEKAAAEAADKSDEKKRELKKVEDEAGEKRKASLDAAKKELEDTLSETEAELKSKTTKAREVRDKKLKDAKDAHDKAEANAKAKREAFDHANEKAADKTKERGIVKKSVDIYEKAEKVRKEKKCGGIFAACTATNCCALGCHPDWQNPNYCQCTGPGGAKFCDYKSVNAKYDKETKAMPILTKDWLRLIEANESAADNSQEADEHFKKVAAHSKSATEAALEEFKVSTKTPADAAEAKTAAAKKKKEEKDSAAKALFTKVTAKARGIWEDAEDNAKAKHHTLEKKRQVEADAASSASEAAKQVTQAKMKLASGKSAVESWKRAAHGNTCGEEGDADKLGF